MADKIKSILDETLSIEIAAAANRESSYRARIELVMNSEIAFVIVGSCTRESFDPAEISLKKDEDVFVVLKTKDCCYSFEEKCTYVKRGHFFTLSVKYPRDLRREQKRKFVRAEIDRDIPIFIVSKNERKSEAETLQNSFSVELHNVKSIDISGGGIAFYNSEYIKPSTNIVVDLHFIDPDLEGCRQSAKILRCMKNTGGLYFVGARFIDTPFSIQERINRFVFARIREKTRNKVERAENV